jgi:homogentisate 1,2-dioxygenase
VNHLPLAPDAGSLEGIRNPRHNGEEDINTTVTSSAARASTRGMATLHPAGVHHGPQPGAAECAAKKEMTDEVAVMVECQQPLTVSPEAEKASIEAYATSWARGLGLLDG